MRAPTHLNSHALASEREYRELDLERIREYGPQIHCGHDPRFLRMYCCNGFVRLVDMESGEESPAFRVHYDEREQRAWMDLQRAHRS